MNVLVIDIGGSKVKMKITGDADRRAVPSGSEMTAAEMVAAVRTLSQGLHYDVVSIGYPGPVLDGRILREPRNLGDGWVEFDFQAAFGCR